MTYLTAHLIPGPLDALKALDDQLPTRQPAGLVARYVGPIQDGRLALVSVWASKADSDRFGAEDLGPLLRRVLDHGPSGESVFDFEATDVILAASMA